MDAAPYDSQDWVLCWDYIKNHRSDESEYTACATVDDYVEQEYRKSIITMMPVEPSDRLSFQEIRDRVDILEYVSRFSKITKAGSRYKACCPIHGEKTPSMSIDHERKKFHCFGCGARGDVSDLIKAMGEDPQVIAR